MLLFSEFQGLCHFFPHVTSRPIIHNLQFLVECLRVVLDDATDVTSRDRRVICTGVCLLHCDIRIVHLFFMNSVFDLFQATAFRVGPNLRSSKNSPRNCSSLQADRKTSSTNRCSISSPSSSAKTFCFRFLLIERTPVKTTASTSLTTTCPCIHQTWSVASLHRRTNCLC